MFKINQSIHIRGKKGFSMVETLVSMLIIGVVGIALVPVTSQMMQSKTGTDKNTLKCIRANVSDWYSDATGEIDITKYSTECDTAIKSIKYERGSALTTAKWFAEHGTTAQILLAKKLLRGACDEGGEKACDYFIHQCWQYPNTDDHCDDTATFLDLPYYLHHTKENNANLGAHYIKEELEELGGKMIDTLLDAVDHACDNNQVPNNNQNLNKNYACDLSEASLHIKGCNAGYATSCTEAFDNNWNKSCSQVKAAWPEAPDGYYQLTYKGHANPVKIECIMDSDASAAITGCTNMARLATTVDADYCAASPITDATECSDDCFIGNDKLYNTTCADIYRSWKVKDGYFALTADSIPPAEDASIPYPKKRLTQCFANEECINAGPGTKCKDGTYYAGQFDGSYIFVTPYDQGSPVWADKHTVLTGINAPEDGEANTTALVAASDYFAPYTAAEECNKLNDASVQYLGQTDWYLPAIDELKAIIENQAAIGYFNYDINTYYVSSTEYDADNAWGIASENWVTNDSELNVGAVEKEAASRVRCARSIDPTTECPGAACPTGCANPGDTCSDGSKFAGTLSGKNLYVPPQDAGLLRWNNGKNGFTQAGAFDLNDGRKNATMFLNPPASNNVDAPYHAVELCESLNSANDGDGTAFDRNKYYKHNDWYLPAIQELEFLYDNRNLKDGINYNSGYYSSTECTGYYFKTPYSKIQMESYEWFGCQDKDNRIGAMKTRCIRRLY